MGIVVIGAPPPPGPPGRRPKPVVAGYTPLPALGLALVYNLRQSANRADFMAPAAEAIDVINAASAARAQGAFRVGWRGSRGMA